MSKKPYRVELDPEMQKILAEIKKSLGLDSEAETLRACIKFAYQLLKERGLIKEKT